MDGNHRAVALYLTSSLIGHSVYVGVHRDVRYYCRYPHSKPAKIYPNAPVRHPPEIDISKVSNKTDR